MLKIGERTTKIVVISVFVVVTFVAGWTAAVIAAEISGYAHWTISNWQPYAVALLSVLVCWCYAFFPRRTKSRG